MIRKIVLYYLCTFLILNMFLGFLLKYMALENIIVIHPGHIVRGILLFVLSYYFLKKIFYRIDNLAKILLYIYLIWFISLLINYFYEINYFIEIYNLLKLYLFLLLTYFIYHHKDYFIKYEDKIININFYVLSANIFFSFFTGIGIEARDTLENTTKGMFYAGNSVAVLLLAFFVYYVFTKEKKALTKYAYAAISVVAMYIVSTKAIFAVPAVLGFYILFSSSKSVYMGFYKRVVALLFVLTTLAFFSTSLLDLYNKRYHEMIRDTNIIHVFEGSDISALEEYRRTYFASVQFNNQINDPLRLIAGYGRSGQMLFWEKQGYHRLQFSGMDFMDAMFQYGIFFAIILYYLLFKAILKNKFTDPIVMSMSFIVIYSIFGGYVLHSLSISSLLAFFVGVKYVNK